MTAHTTLHIDCNPDDKADWLLSARISGMRFDDWVVQQLNAAKIDSRPDWVMGLSERATIVLLLAGFNSFDCVAHAINNNFDFARLPNAGNRVAGEIKNWVSKKAAN